MNKRQLQKELARHEKLRECARAFGIVGDLTRLQICWLLCHHPELSVTGIADLLEKDVSLISHALRKLKEKGVVSGRREAKRVFYSLEKSSVSKLLKESFS